MTSSSITEPSAGTGDRKLLDEVIRALAPLTRAPGSADERRAAEWIATRFEQDGFRTQIDEHPIHGHFWRPIGLLSAISAAAGVLALRGKRKEGAVLAALAGAGLVDDITCRTYFFRKLLGRRLTTTNVVAEHGDPDAPHTLVFMAHHDAAQSGLVFHPGPQKFIAEHFPQVIEKNDTAAPMWWSTFAAPALTVLGAITGRRGITRTGIGLATGTALAMADVGRHATVPGANDNLTGVAVLVALARRLREKPVENVRVILLSAGAEETLQEGIRGFAEKHFPDLPRERTRFVNVDTLGNETLVMLEGEGSLQMEEYGDAFKDEVARVAERKGIALRRGMRARTSTDGLVPMRGGYPTVTLVSMNAWKALDNYHWPTDVPDNVILDTVEAGLEICDAVVRESEN
jgi:hypothetical protein